LSDSFVVDKLSAARRQLEAAILLYFHDGDQIAIHTLTCAAYQVIMDINRQREGLPMFIKERLLEAVRPDKIAEVKKKFNEAQNFLKHADSDPDATVKIVPRYTEYLIWDASLAYERLAGEQLLLSKVFLAWFVTINPDFFKPPREQPNIRAKIDGVFGGMTRRAFFMEALPAIAEGTSGTVNQ